MNSVVFSTMFNKQVSLPSLQCDLKLWRMKTMNVAYLQSCQWTFCSLIEKKIIQYWGARSIFRNVITCRWCCKFYMCFFFFRIPDSIGKDIEKACQGIYPLHDVFIRKVKVLKKPKFDIGKLMEMHGDGGSKTVITDSGETVARPEGYEPPVQQSV